MEGHVTSARGIRAALACSFLAFGLAYASSAAGQSAAPAGPPIPSTEGCTEPVTAPSGPPQLAVGTCIVSTLDEADPVYQNRSPYEEYELSLRPGDTVQIDMDSFPVPDEASPGGLSYGFDTYLELRRAGTIEPLAINDDRPDSLNSRIVFVAPEEGKYIVTARAFGVRAGRYVLRITAAERPETADEIRPGRTLVQLPPATANTAERMRDYYFDGRQNEQVRLSMPAGQSPVRLELVDRSGALVSAGWSPTEDLTQLLAVLPAEGRYYVRVSSDAPELPGFELEMQRAMPPAAAQPERIRRDVPVTGSLVLGAPYDPDIDSFYRLYEVEVGGSEPVTITVDKLDEAFDPIVDVGEQSRLGFAAAATDDDGGGNYNSRLVLPPPHPATLLIRVRSFSLAVGEYRLAVTQAANTQRVFIHFAGTITREQITALAGTLRAGGWRVQGESGQRIPNATGYNEVRYSAETDRAAAEALAAALTRAAVAGAPVRTNRLSIIRPGVLEVWISN